MKRLSVGFVSLGCPKNLVDTERMMELLSHDGAVLTGDQDKADIVVINTCAFLDPAKKESMGTIQEFVDLKKQGRTKGVVVTGCMTERYLGVMRESFPEVDAFLQTKEFSQIVNVVREISAGRHQALLERSQLQGEASQLDGHSELTDFVTRVPGKRSYAYVKISEGCNRVCSFCIIPKLRGKHHSRTIEGIVSEVRDLVAQGTSEVIFIAQDLTSYGRDRGLSLLGLLKEIEKIDGLSGYRLMYNYPRFFTDALISHLASSKKFSRYLDIPFQHISDSVLKGMRRPETSEEIRSLIVKLRKAIPDLFLRTTLMVGFPGETEEDFRLLLDFIEESRFDHLGAFTYFREEGTPSYNMENQVTDEIKQSRLHRLMQLQKKNQKKNLKALLHRELPVIIDGFSELTKSGKVYRGRHYGQAPEVDGLTYVLSETELNVGSTVLVEFQKIVGDYDLLGVVAERSVVDSGRAEVAQLVEQRIRKLL